MQLMRLSSHCPALGSVVDATRSYSPLDSRSQRPREASAAAFGPRASLEGEASIAVRSSTSCDEDKKRTAVQAMLFRRPSKASRG